jgi:outer membrane protein assembly factor BamD
MHKIGIYAIVIFSLLISSCKGFESYQKNPDPNFRLSKANEYYDSKSWYKANQLYASLISVVRGTKNYEELLYRYAYTFYNQKDYLSASYQFRTFVDNFPQSKRAEEAEFMFAKSLYLEAPKYTLDQTSTSKALAALYTFTSMYRNSKFTAEANKYIDDSRKKIEMKESGAARLYFDMGEYRAAKVAYKTVINEYPESENADLYYFMIVKSDYLLAKKGAESKQEERYNDMLISYKQFKELFPNSEYIKTAAEYETVALQQITKIRKNNEHN